MEIMPSSRGLVEPIFRAVLNLSSAEDARSIERKSYPRWDSIRHVELVIRLQTSFGIKFPIDKIAQLNSLAEIESAVAELQQK